MNFKKITIVTALLIVLMSMSLVSAEECSVAGYDYCEEDSDSYGRADADVKLYWRFVDAFDNIVDWGGFAVGGLYLEVGGRGDKFYMLENEDDWDETDCNSRGCSGGTKINKGKTLLATSGMEFKTCLAPFVWDRDDANDGSWVWIYTGVGFLGNNECFYIDVIDCFSNDDCGYNEICSKDGASKDWSCELKICDDGEERCFGPNTQKCESNNWVEKGPIQGKCNVECTVDQQCIPRTIQYSIFSVTEMEVFPGAYCSGNKILKDFTTNTCEDYKCERSSGTNTVDTCGFRCEDIDGDGAICITKVCEDGEVMCSDNNNTLICSGAENKWQLNEECQYGCDDATCLQKQSIPLIVWIITAIVIIFVIIFWVRKKNKR